MPTSGGVRRGGSCSASLLQAELLVARFLFFKLGHDDRHQHVRGEFLDDQRGLSLVEPRLGRRRRGRGRRLAFFDVGRRRGGRRTGTVPTSVAYFMNRSGSATCPVSAHTSTRSRCAGRWPSRSTVGTVNRISTRLPSRRAVASAGAAGALANGGSGGPFLPHAVVTNMARSTRTNRAELNRAGWAGRVQRMACDHVTGSWTWTLDTWTL